MERDNRTLLGSVIRNQLEESLENLGMDYVDIYMTHVQSREPFKTPIGETMGTLMELKDEGKIRASGVSSCSREEFLTYLEYGPVDVVQKKFSMLDVAKAEELPDTCESRGILFQEFSSLKQGLLSGGLGMDYVVPQTHVCSRNIW